MNVIDYAIIAAVGAAAVAALRFWFAAPSRCRGRCGECGKCGECARRDSAGR